MCVCVFFDRRPLPTFTMQHVLYYTHTDTHTGFLLKSQKKKDKDQFVYMSENQREGEAKATNYKIYM